MKKFEDFLKKGDVRKQARDLNLANALIKSSEKSVRNIMRTTVDDLNAESLLSEIYDAIREIIDSILSLGGYKSYSHEASILFLERFSDISESERLFLDNLRKVRNGIKYYGKEIDSIEVKKVMGFMDLILPKLYKILETVRSYEK